MAPRRPRRVNVQTILTMQRRDILSAVDSTGHLPLWFAEEDQGRHDGTDDQQTDHDPQRGGRTGYRLRNGR